MPGPTFSVFAPITKVDAVKRLVYGVLASEALDKSGEALDYETSAPLIKEWSGEVEKNSGGKSQGNLRLMHQPEVVGKFVSVQCDDARKAVDVCAHVSDDKCWGMVERGELTGFSIGGKYEKRWKDDAGVWKYTARPAEGSVVDNPCNPDAVFTMVKADGTTATRHFSVLPEPEQGFRASDGSFHKRKDEARAHEAELLKKAAAANDPTAKLEAALAKADAAVTKAEEQAGGEPVAKKDYSDEERAKMAESGEAMPGGGFPIKNTADLHNAIQSIGRASSPKSAKAHIKTRAKALGAEDMLPDSWKDGADKSYAFVDLRKGLYEVADFACLLQQVERCQQSAEYEAAYEGDDSDMGAKLKEWLAGGVALLRAMVDEETGELFTPEEAVEHVDLLELSHRPRGIDALAKVLGMKAPAWLAKVGARHGKDDAMHLDAAHDHVKAAMGDGGDDCDKYMPGAEKSAAMTKMAHVTAAHNMMKSAGADCPGGDSECAPYGAKKAADGDGYASSPDEHIQAAHDHLAKMGIGACAKEAAAKLAKAGARHSKADMEALTHAHDALGHAGAKCPGGDSACTKDEEPEEKEAAAGGELQKLLAASEAKSTKLEESLAKATDAITTLTARVDKFAKLPLPRPHERAPTRTVTKGDPDPDDFFASLEKLSPDERNDALKEYARALPPHVTR